MAEFTIREMTRRDIGEVLLVDEICFTSPWARDIYEREIIENDFAYYFVIEESGEIIGYVGVWLIVDDAQVTNIAILPEYRGHGIGEKLFGFAMQFVVGKGASKLSLEVRVSNKVAQSLYKKFGLEKGGIRKNYYPDNGEDAYVMWMDLL
jgi:ribosomal-protein-alanine N-acetyltransferase